MPCNRRYAVIEGKPLKQSDIFVTKCSNVFRLPRDFSTIEDLALTNKLCVCDIYREREIAKRR